MSIYKSLYPAIAGILAGMIVLFGCKAKPGAHPDLISSTEEMQEKASGLIRKLIDRKNNTVSLLKPDLTALFYEKNGYGPYWSVKDKWNPSADSLFRWIKGSRLYGLFPEDYHLEKLSRTRELFLHDSLSRGDRRDAGLWAQADLLCTDAFFQIISDLKLGRLPNDSISLNRDSVLAHEFYFERFMAFQGSPEISVLAGSLEPDQRGYRMIKSGIKKFLDNADFRDYTLVPFPGKDSGNFKTLLQKRLYEGSYISFDSLAADSSQLAQAVKKFQKEKEITVDGRAGEGTIRMLNLSDREKFIRIAISLDKYKKLPAVMPEKYIWVNTSSNFLDVVEAGEVKFSSRVICGKPKTRTPLLSSAVSALITYPQWVPPPSIITKEILPAVKKNPAYLAKKGFSLVDNKGDEVDPFTVDWSKYSKSIPYRVVQGSGDANALGVLKFHFDNKYSVYLHDTNQRYLFANAMRSMSHGCVRVQEWQRLAFYILENDSLHSTGKYSRADSVKTWLKNKEKHQLVLKNRMPVFIRYFTCEGSKTGLVFFDDVYGEDRELREKYFASK